MRRRTGVDRPGSRSGPRRIALRPGVRLAGGLMFLALLAGCVGSRKQQVVRSGLPSAHAVRSQQVLLLTDAKLPQEEEVLEELGQVRSRLLETLDIPPGEREVVVYLFADRDRYAQYMRETHPNLPARRAFFIGSSRELAVYAHWGDQVLVDLRHEYTHGLLHASIGHVPLWLDEGLAEYFEVGADAPGNVNSEHLPRLMTAASSGWRPDLRRLEQLEQVGDMRREDYQEAWAWVHFLLHDAPHGRELISQYLRELRRGESAAPLSARIGPELGMAESQLARYVLSLDGGGGILPAGYPSRGGRALR